jgi:hypothetical protein
MTYRVEMSIYRANTNLQKSAPDNPFKIIGFAGKAAVSPEKIGP